MSLLDEEHLSAEKQEEKAVEGAALETPNICLICYCELENPDNPSE
jgi:hypothetical protein